MSLHVPIIIEETAGIDRTNEPVTVGIPFPKGLLTDTSGLCIVDPDAGHLPLQTQVLATWHDDSLKWVLLDFQASVRAKTTKELKLTLTRNKPEATADKRCHISTEEGQDHLRVDTGTASFFVNTQVLKPLDRVVIGDNKIVDGTKSRIVLTDVSGAEYEPRINNMFFETKGPLRTTLKVEGEFRTSPKSSFAAFFSRVHLFANSSLVKIEFTILNPRAAKHPGGLWDLGDPGSIFFKDLSIHTALNTNNGPPSISYQLYEDPVPMDYQNKLTAHSSQLTAKDPGSFTPLNDDLSTKNAHELRAESYELNGGSHLLIYQDSSGGENWKSRNHVNRNNEVKNSFRGYRIYENGKLKSEGLRANPVISISDEKKKIAASVQYFWQNFPKGLEAEDNTIAIRLFPKHFDDVFELQGGEQKTHTVFLNFGKSDSENYRLDWIQTPLIPRATPEWYAKSKAFYYLIPEIEDPNKELIGLINTAINGSNTFFHRREIIDEYGWRNFGEFYADHEAVGHKGTEPFISHYNNQYDCIYGALMQFVRSGDAKWFILADQLCDHVKDIDIYHTDDDRPEFNHGLFWHTEHYLDAQTATHRCSSIRHAKYRDLANYGGGPSQSHNYSSGFIYHYYLTGDQLSKTAVIDLASFIVNSIDMAGTLTNKIISMIKKTSSALKSMISRRELVQYDKVYGLDGPGRASGNSLNTLLDAYVLTNDSMFLEKAEDLICACVHPDDDIHKRDLLDAENRWMYTIFFQALGKYLDLKIENNQLDFMFQYGVKSLVNYGKWMVENEYPYLEKPEKLEYPNETWAAQDIRKCNALLFASKYADSRLNQVFIEKAEYFFQEALKYLYEFETKDLTRPIVLMLLNGFMNDNRTYSSSIMKNLIDIDVSRYKKSFNFNEHILKCINREFQYVKWRIISKLRAVRIK
ncbi:MAG: hypothetical protein KKI12_00250 [Proteobacteria bacterium]|nr:hypothetical protein [Pseudomonadota bacterium]MBU4286587.1 hypothetical protein [Pseudomonadota bacterium]MCG2758653.1 hypothetical protein [Desulfobacteraceae bacterium]